MRPTYVLAATLVMGAATVSARAEDAGPSAATAAWARATIGPDTGAADVTPAPGGDHLMLAHPLRRGEAFPLTLRVRRAASITVPVPVEEPSTTHPGGPGGAMPDMTMPGTLAGALSGAARATVR